MAENATLCASDSTIYPAMFQFGDDRMSTTAHLLALMLLGQAPIVGPSPANPARINTDPAPIQQQNPGKSAGNFSGAPQPNNGAFQLQNGNSVLQNQGGTLNLQDNNPNGAFVPNPPPANLPFQLNQNSAIRPAEFQSQANIAAPQVTNVPAAGDSSAPLVLKLSLSPPAVDAITGEDVSLAEAVGSSYNLQRQSQIVKAYWRLSHALGTYNLNRESLELLVTLPVTQNQTDMTVLKAAIQQGRAEVAEARLMIIAQQYQVAELVNADDSSSPPLPSDSPWVGMYRSNFEKMFAGRSKPVGIRRLHKSFPLYVDLIDQRAEAVLTAQDAFSAMAQAYRGGQAPMQDVLDLHGSMSKRRREFLLSVRDYNFSIADYATNAVHSGGVNNNHYVAMLIPSTTSQKTKSVLLNKQ
jgi:hypothetical protein